MHLAAEEIVIMKPLKAVPPARLQLPEAARVRHLDALQVVIHSKVSLFYVSTPVNQRV